MITPGRSPVGRAVRLALSAVSIVTMLAGSPAASADPGPSPTETRMARDQFRAGMEAARSNDWEGAREAFERSFQIAPRPITLLNLATAQLQTQRYVAAAESYRRFLREAASGPAAAQRDTAKDELARAEAHIAHAQLTVRGLEKDDRLLLDGDTVPALAVTGLEIPLDPGDHTLAIARGDAELVRQTVHLDDHETRAITLTVPAAPAASRATPREESAPRAVATSAPASPRSWAQPSPAPLPAAEPSRSIFASPWLWTAVGVVAVGGATAIVLGARSGSAAPAPYAGNVAPGTLVIP